MGTRRVLFSSSVRRCPFPRRRSEDLEHSHASGDHWSRRCLRISSIEEYNVPSFLQWPYVVKPYFYSLISYSFLVLGSVAGGVFWVIWFLMVPKGRLHTDLESLQDSTNTSKSKDGVIASSQGYVFTRLLFI